jgi:hypothetical protein
MRAMEYGPDAIERDPHARSATFRNFRTVVQQHSMSDQAMLARFSKMASARAGACSPINDIIK